MRKALIKALVAAIILFACAELAFATVGRSSLGGVPSSIIRIVVVTVALVTFIVLVATQARRADSGWLPPTLGVAVAVAAGAAFAHALAYGVRVEFGGACNQCQPFSMLLVYPAVAALVAAIGASLVGMLARRV